MGGIDVETLLVVGMLLSFAAGALSFLSPCVLPIFPAFLSYITGVSVKELQGKHDVKIRRKLMSHSVFFLLGVSLVFITLGIGASFLGEWIQSLLYGPKGKLIQQVAGVFIIFMGLFVAGWITIPTLMKDTRFQAAKKPVGYLGTLFVGVGFAAGWTPCIGPIFGSILILATSNPGQGITYTIMYVLGFALPFFILTFFLGSTRWITKYSGIIMKIGGVVMIIMGLLLFSGQMTIISEYLLRLIQGTWLTKLG